MSWFGTQLNEKKFLVDFPVFAQNFFVVCSQIQEVQLLLKASCQAIIIMHISFTFNFTSKCFHIVIRQGK